MTAACGRCLWCEVSCLEIKRRSFYIRNEKCSSYVLLVYDLQRKRACFGTQSQQKPHGWAEDNGGHLSSVCFLWCAATKLCCQNTQGCPCALLCAQGQAHWSTFTAYWLRWGMPVCWQSAGTIAAVFESEGGFFFAGWLHNHAIINLNWSSLAAHRKTLSTLRQRRRSPWVTQNRNWS